MLENKKIIFEQAYAGGADSIKLLEESVTPGGQYKIVFRAKLQEAGVVNNNKRVYPTETLQQVYTQLKEKALARKLVGELDHPQPQGDQASKIKRSSTISLERACFLMRDLEWDGNAIYGICETLSNRAGMDIYGLLKDQVTIGFSLRAFGETRQRSDGTVEVIPKGLKALTYDAVANPSHDSSVILEFLSESENANEIIRGLQTEMLEESNRLKEGSNKKLLEETSLTAQFSENTRGSICLGNICTIAPLEEAVSYILEQVVDNTRIPTIKVKKL